MNVYEAAVARMEYIFANFDNVYVAFSGGKDSGVMLNLAIEHVRKHYPGRKLGVYHTDYEAQYQVTTDYVDQVLADNQDILQCYRICLPIAAGCSTSMYSDHWIPWDADKKDIWVRDMPENSINESNHEFPWFVKGMRDYDLQEKFSHWIHKKMGATKTACLVGIRTDESMNRWRAIHSTRNKNKHEGQEWTLELAKGVYNAYPIYDFKTEDIWTANGKFGWTYNKLYDLFQQAGVPLGNQRVASPFHEHAITSLKLYKVIDPKNWGKMVGRTNGVNFAGLYGGTTAMGWKSIQLPTGHTWKSYMEFLLTTLPTETADNYRKKLEVSQEFWLSTGGCLSDVVVNKLKALRVEIIVGEKTARKTDKLPIRMAYLDDVDIEEFQAIPTYKRMCVCIMKNDHLCKYMGFGLNKSETERRERAENTFKNLKEKL